MDVPTEQSPPPPPPQNVVDSRPPAKQSPNEARKRKASPKKQPKESKPTPTTKTLLSEQLGTGLAQGLMSPATDIDSMTILQRLQLHKEEALLGSRIDDFNPHPHENSTSTTIMTTTSITSKNVLAQGNGHHRQVSTSITVSLTSPSTPSLHNGAAAAATPYPKKRKNDIHTFTLHDFTAIAALSSLVERHGRVSHMGILDPSYRFFMTRDRRAALYYKVRNNVAVVGGDPLCDPSEYGKVLDEFRSLRKRRRWGIVFLGATDSFATYASSQKWVTMRFGTERVLNPLNNPVLQEKEQRRLLTQNRQLLDPERGGVEVHAYVPAQGRDEDLETKLRAVYDSWRDTRNTSAKPQAYMTVFDPFAIPTLMTYLYTTDRATGNCNGFAALRKIGANKGYHIDPYCALADAPKGITDLLVFSALSLLQQAGIGYLSFGFEPAVQLDEITGLSRLTTHLTKSCYRRAFRHLPIGGKKAYHDKFRPDPALDSGLHIIYPDGAPSLQDALATLHFANIEVGGLLRREIFGGWWTKDDGKDEKDGKEKENGKTQVQTQASPDVQSQTESQTS